MKPQTVPSPGPLMIIDRGPRRVPPRLGTSIAVAPERWPRPCGAAWGAQPGHRHRSPGTSTMWENRGPSHVPPRDRGGGCHAIRHPRGCEGAGLSSPANPHLSPQGAPDPMREHPWCIRLDHQLGKAPASARHVSAAAGLVFPSHGVPSLTTHPAPTMHPAPTSGAWGFVSL